MSALKQEGVTHIPPLSVPRLLIVIALAVGGVVALGYHYRGSVSGLFSSDSVQSLVAKNNPTADVTCSKGGLMAFAGSSASVYDCNLSFPTVSVWRCYVRADGDLYEVTDQVRSLGGSGKGFRCATSSG